jgi:hypothetical protein
MNYSNAVDLINRWLNQKSFPKELEPFVVWDVLASLDFRLKGKNSSHTTYRYYHECLLKNESYFKYGIISISVGHSKGSKTVIRIDSVRKLMLAFSLYMEWENEKKN